MRQINTALSSGYMLQFQIDGLFGQYIQRYRHIAQEDRKHHRDTLCARLIPEENDCLQSKGYARDMDGRAH